ncbi:hypothetical protein ACFQ1E_18145 [Sphingomonas canadensis]|uniref:Uncharacterized protein n=1 Tax=Sphingomonas canadensis TaxID=1219257 RepID=A0ABW3H9V1_9SPHN|nr:hypothetical protein [Sphingomonas canadensis]MCW3837937.1 hypothetical protein [Sphingomonas canadensis]
MHESEGRRRVAYAVLFAILAGALLMFGNPVNRIKADLRADAKGFVFSLEYGAKATGLD